MKTYLVFITWFLFTYPAVAQMRAVSVEKLPLGNKQEWLQPVFSPDGTRIFFTTSGFNGIWEYTISTRAVRQITASPRSGFGLAISADGKTISYRRTSDETSAYRTQELVTQDLSTNVTEVLEKGENVSLPIFLPSPTSSGRSPLVYMKGGKIASTAASVSSMGPTLLGIEDTKIVLLRKGQKVILDPFGNGSYIWPSLSPDGTKLLAYEMSHGTFISDLDGNVIRLLGRKDDPSWTRDGKWIVYMDDKDDGDNILSSDIYCVSADGSKTVQLTNTGDVIELYPSCSPTEDKIACSSLSGEVYVIAYSEEGSR